MNEKDEKKEQTRRKIVALYKEPKKKVQPMKIENSDEEFKKILGGEIEKYEEMDTYIIYRKDSEKMDVNFYSNTSFNSLPLTVRGPILLVGKDRKTKEIISFTRENIYSYCEYLIRESHNYSNQDETRRFLTKRERKLRELYDFKQRKAETKKYINNFYDTYDTKNEPEKAIENVSKTNENKKCETKDESKSNLPPKSESNMENQPKGRFVFDLSGEDNVEVKGQKVIIYFEPEMRQCIKAMLHVLFRIREIFEKM